MKLKQHKGGYHLIDENDIITDSFGFHHPAITPELRAQVAKNNPLEVEASYTIKDGWIIKPK